MTAFNLCPECGKRCFPSPRAAKRASRKMSGRLRVYWHGACASYHVTTQRHRGVS